MCLGGLNCKCDGSTNRGQKQNDNRDKKLLKTNSMGTTKNVK